MSSSSTSGLLRLIALMPLTAVLGCATGPPGGTGGSQDESDASPADLVQSAENWATSPDLPEGDLEELVTENNAFSFDLYQQVNDGGGNIFFSPHSISVALAMTYAGARGETEQQMAETLRFTLPQDHLHPAFTALDLELASRAETSGEDEEEGFQLHIVNRLWPQIGYVFLESFLEVLDEHYRAGLSPQDLFNSPVESRVTINDWVAEQTEERITDLIPPGMISPLTRLVLTNAVYFKASWSKPFREGNTQDEPFYQLDGGTVTVPMMRRVATLNHTRGRGYQVVELPYEGDQLSMVVFLPDDGEFEDFDDTLDAVTVAGGIQSLRARLIDLSMPRFTFEWSTFLSQTLSAMGMPNAFGAADFSGMTEEEDLFIGEVIHKAFVAVDEEGTEAAAATAVVLPGTSAPDEDLEEPLVVRIDRPFAFIIRDIVTGSILFVGRVVDLST